MVVAAHPLPTVHLFIGSTRLLLMATFRRWNSWTASYLEHGKDLAAHPCPFAHHGYKRRVQYRKQLHATFTVTNTRAANRLHVPFLGYKRLGMFYQLFTPSRMEPISFRHPWLLVTGMQRIERFSNCPAPIYVVISSARAVSDVLLKKTQPSSSTHPNQANKTCGISTTRKVFYYFHQQTSSRFYQANMDPFIHTPIYIGRSCRFAADIK